MISETVKRKLWAFSAGHCCNPSCHKELFSMSEDGSIKCIGELAHIIGRKEKGPRGKSKLPLSQRDDFNNLIVLCPSCHTMVDNNPDTYTDELLRNWKKEREESISRIMSVPFFQDREEARNALIPLLEENKAIYVQYGPCSENATKNQADSESMWFLMSLQKIIPNNRKIEAILGNNQHLMTEKERLVYNQFKLHREGFEFNKKTGDVNPAVPLFPKDLNNIFL